MVTSLTWRKYCSCGSKWHDATVQCWVCPQQASSTATRQATMKAEMMGPTKQDDLRMRSTKVTSAKSDSCMLILFSVKFFVHVSQNNVTSIFCWIVTHSGNRWMRNENKWWDWSSQVFPKTKTDLTNQLMAQTGRQRTPPPCIFQHWLMTKWYVFQQVMEMTWCLDYRATCAVTLHGQNSHCSGCPRTAQWLGCAARLLWQQDAPSFDLSNNYIQVVK